MAGRRVDDDVWNRFLDLRERGFSVERAAGDVGVAVSTVWRNLGDSQSRLSRLRLQRGEAVKIDVSVVGRRGLEDFGFFRERYLARARVPWADEAAGKISELLATDRREFLVVNAPPGVGKSTFFTHDLPVWLICRDRSIRIMIGSRTEKQARTLSNRIRRTLEREVPVLADTRLKDRGLARDAEATLVADYGIFKPANNDLWRAEEFVVQQPSGVAVEDKESTVTAYGMDSGFLGGRFDFVIWDDLVDKKTIRGDQDQLITWYENEAETRLEPGGLFVLQGQRLNANDLYRYALDLKDWSDEDDVDAPSLRKYHHIKFQAHYEDRCKGGKHENVKPYPQGCLLDPQRLSWRELQRLKQNSESRYLVVYQQEDVDPENQLVPREWIDGGVSAQGELLPGCWDDDRPRGVIPKNLGGDWFSVVTADPSPSRYWSVQWWLYQPETEMQYLIDMHRAPMEAPDFLDWNHHDGVFYGLLEDWWVRASEAGKPFTSVIVEQNAAQRFLLQYDHVRRWSAQRGVTIVPHSTHRNKIDPDYGVQTIAPHYRFGRVRLPGNRLDGSRKAMEPLVTELATWPDGKTEDCIMAHWFLIWNAPRLFHVQTKPVKFNRPSWMGRASRWS